MKKFKRHFLKALLDHIPEKAADMHREIDQHFKLIQGDIAFAKTSKNPMDKRMDIAGYLLAAIKCMDKEKISYEKIRKIILEAAEEYVRPKNRIQQAFRIILAKAVGSAVGRFFLKILNNRIKRSAHKDGFLQDVLTGKEETLGFGYGVDILECGICKLFSKHQYTPYAPILCEVDYITTSLAGLKLIRTGTIANGAAKCDFRFTKA